MFDSNAYRKEVLRPLLDSGGRDFSDAFALIGLDPEVDQEAVIRSRLDDVVAFWRKEQSSPRYKSLVTALLAERDEISATLLDPARRRALRQTVVAGRQVAEAAKFARLDETMATLEQRFGGIPRDRVDRLRALAQSSGVTPAEFEQRLGARRVIEQRADVEPLAAPLRRQITALLEELGHLQEPGNPGTGPRQTLYDFLGVSPTSHRRDLISRRETLAARNRQRRHDRLRTVVDELLALTTTVLLEQDPAAYLAGLDEDVRDRLRPEIDTVLLLEDSITAPEFERLLRLAITAGTTPEHARGLLLDLARSMHAPVEVGAAVDYVVCAGCQAPQARSSESNCSRCGEALYRDCPRCRRSLERSALRCSGCQLDVRALDEAEADLLQARQDLDAGLVAEAKWRVDLLGPAAGDLPEVRRLAAEIEARLRVAAETWSKVRSAIAADRLDDARDFLDHLTQTSSDVRAPDDGATIPAVRAELDASLERIGEAVAEVERLEANQREARLLQLFERHPSSSQVLAALRRLPIVAPGRVTIVERGASLVVSWRASRSAGDIEYRVARSTRSAAGTKSESRPVGSTRGHELEDAGATRGATVSYTVTAVRHGITSGASSSGTIVHAPDVDQLAAVEHDGAIELKWTRGWGDVWVERSDLDDQTATVHRMRGGDHGLLDTNIAAGHHYRYRIFIEFRDDRGEVQKTRGREVTATGFVLPPMPPAPSTSTVNSGVRIELPAPLTGVTARIVRSPSRPTIGAGAVIDARRLEEVGAALADDGDTAFDECDGRPRWYTAVRTTEGQAVVGPPVAHPGLGEVEGLAATTEGTDLVLRWNWPTGCTEALVTWAIDRPPTHPGDPAARVAKCTNTAYEIKQGWRLPTPPVGQFHGLVVAIARVDGDVVHTATTSDASRVTHFVRPRIEVSWTIRRSGMLRRSIQVDIAGGEGRRPPLLIVARYTDSADVPPARLGVIGPDDATASVNLADVKAPAVLELMLDKAEMDCDLVVASPPADERIIS